MSLPSPLFKEQGVAVDIVGLSKMFRPELFKPSLTALHPLDLRIAQREIFGVLGSNGAGKSTTFRLLMGLIRPSSGSASLFNFPVGTVQALEKVGYLPDQATFYEYLTASESLAFCAELGRVPKQQLGARVETLLGLVGLSDARYRRLRTFSKGMLQRLGIAQALIHDPPLLILDEPMSGLDPIGRVDVRKLLFRLKHEGKTIIFSSHLLQDVETLCDRVGILVRGRMTKMGRLSEIIGGRSLSWPDSSVGSSVDAIDDLFSDREPRANGCTA